MKPFSAMLFERRTTLTTQMSPKCKTITAPVGRCSTTTVRRFDVDISVQASKLTHYAGKDLSIQIMLHSLSQTASEIRLNRISERFPPYRTYFFHLCARYLHVPTYIHPIIHPPVINPTFERRHLANERPQLVSQFWNVEHREGKIHGGSLNTDRKRILSMCETKMT